MIKGFFGTSVMAAVILIGCTEGEVGSKPVEVKEEVVAKEEDDMKLDITVPEVDGLEPFNQQALKLGEDLEDEVRASEQAVVEGETELHAEGYMDFETMFLDEQTISVLLNASLYEAGGMNFYSYKETLNYNLQTGEIIEMKDLFDGDNYKGDLLEAAQSEIEGTDLEDNLSQPFTEIKEGQQFYLTADHVVLVFDQYEITPGVQNPPEIAIEKKELKNLKEAYK